MLADDSLRALTTANIFDRIAILCATSVVVLVLFVFECVLEFVARFSVLL